LLPLHLSHPFFTSLHTNHITTQVFSEAQQYKGQSQGHPPAERVIILEEDLKVAAAFDF
jgi:hypothetical protein